MNADEEVSFGEPSYIDAKGRVMRRGRLHLSEGVRCQLEKAAVATAALGRGLWEANSSFTASAAFRLLAPANVRLEGDCPWFAHEAVDDVGEFRFYTGGTLPHRLTGKLLVATQFFTYQIEAAAICHPWMHKAWLHEVDEATGKVDVVSLYERLMEEENCADANASEEASMEVVLDKSSKDDDDDDDDKEERELSTAIQNVGK